MTNTLDDLKQIILDSVEERAGRFLADHSDAKTFLQDRAVRLAELGVDLTLAGSPAERERIEGDMKVVRQSMENEIDRLALDAKSEAKAWFKEVVDCAVSCFVRLFPVILKSIR